MGALPLIWLLNLVNRYSYINIDLYSYIYIWIWRSWDVCIYLYQLLSSLASIFMGAPKMPPNRHSSATQETALSGDDDSTGRCVWSLQRRLEGFDWGMLILLLVVGKLRSSWLDDLKLLLGIILITKSGIGEFSASPGQWGFCISQ